MRRIFGPKNEEVIGKFRILHYGILIICPPHPILFV
jgi:hypothetical protein